MARVRSRLASPQKNDTSDTESEKANTAEMTNQDQAIKWFANAEKAIANGDVEALKSACRQLCALLPAKEQRHGYGATSIAAKDAVYGASSD